MNWVRVCVQGKKKRRDQDPRGGVRKWEGTSSIGRDWEWDLKFFHQEEQEKEDK